MKTNKLISAIFLIAGTAIGAGTIALPMVLSKIGLWGSCLLMLITWLVGYYSALMGIELNLRAHQGLPIGALGKKFSGPNARLVGNLSLLFLCYGLSCAYISGSGSVLSNISAYFNCPLSAQMWLSIISVLLLIILCYGVHMVLRINSYIFWLLLGGFGIMIFSLLTNMPTNKAYFPNRYDSFESWSVAIPVLFTSFGFHVIFHTLYNYLDGDKVLLKKAFQWGSLIPVVVYMTWTGATLCYIAHTDLQFYQALITASISVGELTSKLGEMMQTTYTQFIIWTITLFAIFTSLLGVSIALMDQVQDLIKKYTHNKGMIACLVIIPPYLVSTYIPEAFIKALGFAGMVLSVLAILLPGYLLFRSDLHCPQSHYPLLNSKSLRFLIMAFGVGIILFEIFNMMS